MKKSYAFMLVAGVMALTTGMAGASGGGLFGVGGCTTVLPLFPTPAGAAPDCTAPTGATTTPLPTDGIIQWIGAGVDDQSHAYAIAANGVPAFASLSATVPSYSEPCVAGEPSAIGLASGVITITAPVGTVVHDPPPLISLLSATLTSDYAWVRVGLQAVIRSGVLAGGGGSITFSNGDTDTGILGVFADTATATLVPIPPLGTCAAPLPLEVHVVVESGAYVIQ